MKPHRHAPPPTPTVSVAAAIALAVVGLALAPAGSAARLGYLEQMPVETYAKLREVERHQLGVAEKYYQKGDYKVALAEYEKYLTLYESGPGAPYAQLMWSHCQVKLRKINTAIKDGFRTVVDYWPETHEAVLAGFLVGHSYKLMGELKPAEKAYAKVAAAHPGHRVAVLAKVDLLDIARIRGHTERRVELWKELTYKIVREDGTRDHCVRASRDLASYFFHAGNYDEGQKALATTYRGHRLLEQTHDHARGAIRRLVDDAEKRDIGLKLADRLIKALEAAVPADLEEKKNRDRAIDLHYRVASVHSSARRDLDQMLIYQRMERLFGQWDGLLGRMADWYKGHKQREKAREIYGRFEDQIKGQSAIAHIFREEGEHDEAIAIYRKLMELDPGGADGWQWQIAECYEQSGQFKLAIATYRQTDRFPDSYFRMAGCHRKLKQWKDALGLYLQLLSHDGSAPEALLQAGYTYEQAGQRENAIRTFQRTCKQHPRSGQASRAHAHLQSAYKITVTLGGATDE